MTVGTVGSVMPNAAMAPSAANVSDLVWRDTPNAWHQGLARIVDHRFSTFPELLTFARNAKKAGVSALMLIQIQKTSQCPGPWYNGLQLCDHINGSYPAADGTLAEWRAMLNEIRPMRLMWWTNPTYWSVQGPVWAQATADKTSDVGQWFSWGPESCEGIPPCCGANVVVPNVGCAQGSWGSESGFSGVKSAMASFGSAAYADYMVDSMANSWTANLGIDGCMLGRGLKPYSLHATPLTRPAFESRVRTKQIRKTSPPTTRACYRLHKTRCRRGARLSRASVRATRSW